MLRKLKCFLKLSWTCNYRRRIIQAPCLLHKTYTHACRPKRTALSESTCLKAMPTRVEYYTKSSWSLPFRHVGVLLLSLRSCRISTFALTLLQCQRRRSWCATQQNHTRSAWEPPVCGPAPPCVTFLAATAAAATAAAVVLLTSMARGRAAPRAPSRWSPASP